MTGPAVAIMAKAPAPGAVKTRLCPPLAPAQAAALAHAFLLDKIGQVRTLRGARPVVAFAPADAAATFRALAPDFGLLAQRGPDLGARLADSLETALRLADGVVQVEPVSDGGKGGEPLLFSERLACAGCGVSLPEVSPRMFSFNNPYGACPDCGGLGSRDEIDPERLVPNPERSLRAGALAPWAGRESTYFRQTLEVLARRHRFSLDTPWSRLRKPVREVILHGEHGGGFEGVVATLERRYRETTSEEARAEIAQFMAERPCPACGGARLRRESLGFAVAGRSIADVGRLTIGQAAAFFDALRLGEREATIARRVLKEIRERLGFLLAVGLDYLTLDRPAGTLSGGEGQRIRLATQIGSSLVGVLYILDEPSIGLHQRDNRRLLETLKRLRDLGNGTTRAAMVACVDPRIWIPDWLFRIVSKIVYPGVLADFEKYVGKSLRS